jgi:hypothetical protein
MNSNRLVPLAAVVLAVAGCARVEAPSRNMPLDIPALGSVAGEEGVVARNYALEEVRAVVPAELRVSERNSYYPFADIVWRGDPVGDRHAQIAALFREAGDRLAAPAGDGQRPVIAEVTLLRFHGVTERTRYSVGGVYGIRFMLAVRDAATGELIEPPRLVATSLPAPGGQAAVELERAGQTERVRVIDHLAFAIARELGLATGA